ncbi:MAG: hypothetical protein U5K31_06065 [Balneolaceae bacterium]|nr:hypothetical protein [Balneolaceae bacterium]
MQKLFYYTGITLLLGFAAYFLGLTVIEIQNQREHRQRETQLEEITTRKIPIEPAGLFEELEPYRPEADRSRYNLDDSDYLALLLVNSKVCTPCINEVHEYISLLQEREDVAIQPVVIVGESDAAAAARFLEIAAYDVPSRIGRNSQIDRIATFQGQELPTYQMLVFADLHAREVVHRSYLATRITSVGSKMSTINEAIGATPNTN